MLAPLAAVAWHPGYSPPNPPGSRFPLSKYDATRDALVQMGVPVRIVTPDPMPREWLAAIHVPAYVDAVLNAAAAAAIERRIGFRITPAVALRAQLSVGGTYLAARLALVEGYAANCAGGSHHALPDSGAGYCVFNDLAVTANRLLAEGLVRRVAIIDLDVHQGDGTAVCLAARPEVFTFSAHAARNFPVRKAVSTRDVPLPDGVGDAGYMAMLEQELPRVLDVFQPDLLLYQAGVDVHADDRLGRLALSDAGLQARDALVMHMAAVRGIPLASTLGGGYLDDIATLGARHARSIASLVGAPSIAKDGTLTQKLFHAARDAS